MARSQCSEVTYRMATAGDHRDIVNILENVFEGLDYLDWALPFYMTHPCVRCFVAVKDSKIVGIDL